MAAVIAGIKRYYSTRNSDRFSQGAAGEGVINVSVGADKDEVIDISGRRGRGESRGRSPGNIEMTSAAVRTSVAVRSSVANSNPTLPLPGTVINPLPREDDRRTFGRVPTRHSQLDGKSLAGERPHGA